MAKLPFQRTRRALSTTTPAEAAIAERGADTPVNQEQLTDQPISRRKSIPRKPFGVPLSTEEREQLERCAIHADKTPRSLSTRLLAWAMTMYEEDPGQLPRK